MRPRSNNPANVQGWYRLTKDQMEKLKAKAAAENRPVAGYVQNILINHLKEQNS